MPVCLSNAWIVQPDRVIRGNLEIEDQLFTYVGASGQIGRGSIDCQGDYLLPGLVDLHTDNVEQHFFPRPAVQWPCSLSAVIAHDSQMLCAGITTVLDSLSLGDYDSAGSRARILKAAIEAISSARSAGILRSDHYFHFRCEISDPYLTNIIENYLDHPMLKLFSVMDHTPGQRQWRNLDLFRKYRRERKGLAWTDDEFVGYLAECRRIQHELAPKLRDHVHRAAATRGIPVASHDDTTIADVDESWSSGITLCEFPTTVEAARRARVHGMRIIMGAPNIVLGGSHSGNVSAATLADEGLLDILTSDYVPTSMLQAVFLLATRGVALQDAVAMVTSRPADALGLHDRGRIESGQRADLLRVRIVDKVPVLAGVWVRGYQYF
ncbi:alpha-D-ribose 1-methylphosphonate 5-triphosphate diphosphatase [Sinorhizobium medicae]|nr:alpha-D-ribose 1-methylphosphonate 5-triphosphate diphosphatase [Sinorhizobium medicae]